MDIVDFLDENLIILIGQQTYHAKWEIVILQKEQFTLKNLSTFNFRKMLLLVKEQQERERSQSPAPGSDSSINKYRDTLPAKAQNFNVSAWSLIKQLVQSKNFRFSVPVELLEPLSLLQTIEDYPRIAMAYVAAFAVSRYAASAYRAMRKPFNPIEGETFEYLDNKLEYKFIAEQVSHHPPISAVNVKGRDWELTQSVDFDLSMWGRTFTVTPKSPVDLVLQNFKESYRWNKVKTRVQDIFRDGRYIEHVGEMVVSSSTHYCCKINFEEKTHNVFGNVYDTGNERVMEIRGMWSSHLEIVKTGQTPRKIWSINSLPPNHKEYYGFTYFALSLNDLTKDIRNLLPPTDSRFRTDKNLLEDGKIKEAALEKQRLEELQRSRCKQGSSRRAMWFNLSTASTLKRRIYNFTDKYWDMRSKKFDKLCFEPLW
uniref:Oxysterol-binding protein n=1 Tax=Romanomermis culicivorax TaxID=13658 RepID=A0A915HQX0_ROMCU